MKPRHQNPQLIAARLSLPFATALFALFNLTTQSASAIDLYWDGNDIAPGAGATPTGTWGIDPFWNTTPAGDVTAPTNVTTTGVDDLFFSAGTDAVDPFVVTVDGSQNARLLTFQEGTATLSGGALITLAGGGITTVGAGATTFSTALTLTGSNTFDVGTALNLNGLLTGDITKTGSGVMTLGGGAAHVISGITVNQGTLVANTSSGDSLLSGISATINSGGTLRWGAGGRFANNAGFTINAGGTLDINNFEDLVGSINGAGNVTGTGRLQLAGGTSVFSGVISGTGMRLNLQSDAAANVTLSGLSTYTGTTTIERGTLNINSIGLVNGAASAVGTPTSAANGVIAMGFAGNSGTLVYTGTGHTTDRQISIGVSGTSGAGGATIQADGASNAALVFSNAAFNVNATGAGSLRTLTLQGASTGNNTISGIIRSNSAGVALTKAGTGTWILGGVNTYTGATNVNAGTLQLSATGRLNNGNYGAALAIAGGATFQYRGSGGQTLSGVVGTGGGILSKAGGGDLILTNGANAYDELMISAGRVFIGTNIGALPSAATVTLTGGTLDFNAAIATYNNPIIVSSGANIAARVATTLSNVTLPGSGSVIFNNDDAVTVGLTITNDQTLSGNLSIQLGGNNPTVGTATLSGIISGASGAITKIGTGTLILSGANTYAGATTVTTGTLSLGNGTANTTLADTAGVVIGTDASAVLNLNYSGTDTVSTLSIDGAAKAAGIWGSSTSGAPNTDPKLTGTGTLTVSPAPASGYSSWILGFGLAPADQDPTDDPENDGMNNLLEFVLNGNPSLSDTSILPTLVVTSTDFEFTYQRRDDSVSPQTTQTFQWGTTLATWPGSAVIPATSGTVGVATITVSPGIPSDAVTDTVKISIPKTESGASGKLFGRLEVVK